jgi:hypothetical protein
MEDGTFIGHSLYATSVADRVERFPSLVPFALAPNHDYETKHAIYLAGHEGARFAPQVRLAAVVLPEVINQPDTTYRKTKTMEAMLALAPSSVWILPGSAGFSLDKLSGLVTTVPSYRLELGRKTEQIAPTVERIWQELVG